VSYTGPPTSVRSLKQRIGNLESSDGLALRRRVGMALIVVGQMLPQRAALQPKREQTIPLRGCVNGQRTLSGPRG
jgi:hypothetical protein